MDTSGLRDILADWRPPLFLTGVCILTLMVYVVGFARLRRTRPNLPSWRALSFVSGVLVLWISLGSPLEELADTILTAHMIEHLLLMVAVPPMVIAGWPSVPMLRGLPAWLRSVTAAPLLRWTALRRALHWLTKPLVAWIAMNLTLLLWHIPAAYDYALEHEGVHDMEHICFLFTSLLFWWVLLRPWPSRANSLGWFALIYLITADFINTILSALLAFTGRPVYSYYILHPNKLGLDPLVDQQVGASIMWVFGSIAFLLPALLLLSRQLRDRDDAETA